MDSPATLVQFWFISITLPNLIFIVGLVVVFVLALLLPFPGHRGAAKQVEIGQPDDRPGEPAEKGNWTRSVRDGISQRWPWHQLLPDRQPRYLASWVYIFGVAAIASLVWIVASGLVLVFFGPAWWHTSSMGRFVNSIHFWSVQAFFATIVLHLWGQFFMAGWRHGRGLTWIVGVGIFAIAIGAAFTGYLSQQNFDSQWIALNGKDALNSTGVGAFFNILDYGQMFGIHVILLPFAVVSLVAVHVLLIRLRGIVKPINWPESKAETAASTTAPKTAPTVAQSVGRNDSQSVESRS